MPKAHRFSVGFLYSQKVYCRGKNPSLPMVRKYAMMGKMKMPEEAIE